MVNVIRKLAESRVKSKVASEVEKELGNKSLTYISRILRGFILIAGKMTVGKQVVKGIEGDLKLALKKNPSATVDELIHEALNTPDYMALLKDLDMDETNLRLLAQEAIDAYGK